MNALEKILSEVEQIQKRDARIFFCHPDDMERVRAAADRILFWPSYWEIRESRFVQKGQIICLDPGALETKIKNRPIYNPDPPPESLFSQLFKPPKPNQFITFPGGVS